MVLGDRIEVSLRRALIITNGDYWALLQGSAARVIVGAALFLLVLQAIAWLFGFRKRMLPKGRRSAAVARHHDRPLKAVEMKFLDERTAVTPGRKLRELLGTGRLILGGGAHDALSARIVAGGRLSRFASSPALASSMCRGYPDVGLRDDGGDGRERALHRRGGAAFRSSSTPTMATATRST